MQIYFLHYGKLYKIWVEFYIGRIKFAVEQCSGNLVFPALVVVRGIVSWKVITNEAWHCAVAC